MLDSCQIKRLPMELGADLSGIAPVARWAEAPAGFRPTDIDPEARSVVVFAKRVPSSTLSLPNPIPYTFVNAVETADLDRLTVALAVRLEDAGLRAVPIPPNDPYEHWEPERTYGRAILSLRHAGWLAGLGVLGRSTLLINSRFGAMIRLGAVLVNVELDPDPLATYTACPNGCRVCLDVCPQQALDGTTVDQHRCRPLSNFRSEKGYLIQRCNLCRAKCPNVRGIRGKP